MSQAALLQPHELAAFDRCSAEQAIRARAQSAYLGANTAVARILGRYKFFVDTRDQGFGTHILLDGYWEIWLTMFLARNLRPGMTVVDVGANFGYYSVLCAEFVGPTGKVVAVEPNPHAAELLARSISVNGFAHCSVERVALDDQNDRQLHFYVPHTEPKNALVVTTTDGLDVQSGTIMQVRSAKADDLLADLAEIDLIKIDAEGSEERIFAGMAETMKRHRPMVIVEFNAARYADPACFVDQLTAAYGGLYSIDFDGVAHAVERQDVLTSRWGEDWLLVLSPRAPT